MRRKIEGEGGKRERDEGKREEGRGERGKERGRRGREEGEPENVYYVVHVLKVNKFTHLSHTTQL